MVVDLFSKNDGMGVKSLAIYEIIALFLPLYSHKAHEHQVDVLFPDLAVPHSLSRDSYAAYLRDLRSHYPLYGQVDTDTLVQLSIALLTYHHLVQLDTPESKDELQAFMRQSLA